MGVGELSYLDQNESGESQLQRNCIFSKERWSCTDFVKASAIVRTKKYLAGYHEVLELEGDS
jgi:hypothetical protein